ncbi:MAG: AIPR family protein [Acidobacteria bacterium]|nr:AIPR family protein [Acidobacteriota bacterium]
MSLAAQIIDQRVTGIVQEQSDAFDNELRVGIDEPRRRSVAFVFLVAKTAFDLTDEQTVDGIVDGGNDFGVDALYCDSPEDGEIRVNLVQGKYRGDLRGDAAFPENGIVQMIDAVGALFDPERPVTLNPRLEQRVEDIRSFVKDGAIPRVTAIAANNGTTWTEQAQQRIDGAARDFGEQVEWRHLGPEELLALLQARKPINADVQLTGNATVETFDFRRALTGRMSVAELARLTDVYGNRLFEKNIRRYLGLAGNRVNEAVAATLREPAQRPSFYFYNNGITITCSKFRHNALQKENWTVKVEGLQIVNGGQTARTVQHMAQEVGAAIRDAEVLVRIYELQQNDVELVESITFATNSQNPVDLRDLKANDPRQATLGESISQLGYTYRAKREERAVSSDEFTSAVVAEAVLAVWRHRPHQARFRSREHFGALSRTIFTDDLNGAQSVTAALLHRHAENRRKRPPSDAPDFLAYGSRFIAMLMGRYLLNDLGIAALRELDHRNFDAARDLVDRNADGYLARAEERIAGALEPLFRDRERTLQRLSATFRRADLVDTLLGDGR